VSPSGTRRTRDPRNPLRRLKLCQSSVARMLPHRWTPQTSKKPIRAFQNLHRRGSTSSSLVISLRLRTPL